MITKRCRAGAAANRQSAQAAQSGLLELEDFFHARGSEEQLRGGAGDRGFIQRSTSNHSKQKSVGGEMEIVFHRGVWPSDLD
jgi:hypothetical protein